MRHLPLSPDQLAHSRQLRDQVEANLREIAGITLGSLGRADRASGELSVTVVLDNTRIIFRDRETGEYLGVYQDPPGVSREVAATERED